MIDPSTLQFLKGLHKNNNREWFLANKVKYEAAKNNFLQFVETTLSAMQQFDNNLNELTAKQCVFRINRDVRFSKNKDPYKNNFGASFNKGAKKIMAAGYYFHLEPGNSFIGGGLWMPEAADLQKLRQEIDYCYKEFAGIINHKKFVNTFGSLSEESKLTRPPKGYDIDNPAIEYLKLKSFTAIIPLKDAEILDKGIVKKSTEIFKTLSPLVHFLNRAIE
jgi:uncharacterized protein (TIGR02453 family)